MKIYGIFNQFNNVVGYFTDLEKAEKYCAYFNNKKFDFYELLCFDDWEGLTNIPAKYEYTVYYYSLNKEKFEPCLTEHECYCAEILRPDSIVHTKEHPDYPLEEFDGDILVVKVNLKEKNESLANKIAQDMINELAAYGNGRLDLDYIELMNIRFKHQREQENKEKGG